MNPSELLLISETRTFRFFELARISTRVSLTSNAKNAERNPRPSLFSVVFEPARALNELA